MRPKAFGIVHGDQVQFAKQINQIVELARKGQAKCVAIRVYMVDGSYQGPFAGRRAHVRASQTPFVATESGRSSVTRALAP